MEYFMGGYVIVDFVVNCLILLYFFERINVILIRNLIICLRW